MRNVLEGTVPGERSRLLLPGWARMLLATSAVHALGTLLSVATIVVYAVAPAGAPVDGFAGTLSTGILPVLTLPAAAWAARSARDLGAAVLAGLVIGLLVAGTLGLLFYGPTDPGSLALFASIAAAGLVGGLLAGRPPARGPGHETRD